MTSLATKKLGYITLGLIAAVSLGIGGAKWLVGQMNSPDVGELLRQGDQQLAADNYSEALRLYVEASQIKPNSNEIKDKIKKVDEAVKLLQAGNTPPSSTSGGTSSGNQSITISPNETQTTNKPSQNSAQKSVPNLAGLTLEQAQQVLLQHGIRYQYVIEPSSAPKNTVFKQSMDAGQPYPPGERITFHVSQGQ
jgi:hypothetical protein